MSECFRSIPSRLRLSRFFENLLRPLISVLPELLHAGRLTGEKLVINPFADTILPVTY